jgi:hypothetical protein
MGAAPGGVDARSWGVGMSLNPKDFYRLALSTRAVAEETAAGSELHKISLPPQPGQSPDSLTSRLADCDGQRNRANMLLNRMYSWRGYGSDHELAAAPNCVTFTASSEEDVIGTLTLTVDSAAGLAVDQTFKQEIDVFRKAPGARLCELTKFAFDTSMPARPRLAALFHIIFIYGSMHYDCTDLFIEVNPRHVRFYEIMLGFKPIGSAKNNDRVNAPAQLMWLNVGYLRGLIDAHAGRGGKGERSLYPYFFSRKEEEGIYGRLVSLADQSQTFRGAIGSMPSARRESGGRERPIAESRKRRLPNS